MEFLSKQESQEIEEKNAEIFYDLFSEQESQEIKEIEEKNAKIFDELLEEQKKLEEILESSKSDNKENLRRLGKIFFEISLFFRDGYGVDYVKEEEQFDNLKKSAGYNYPPALLKRAINFKNLTKERINEIINALLSYDKNFPGDESVKAALASVYLLEFSKDKEKAFKYAQEGSSLGSIEATLILSNCYREGIGTEIDLEKANSNLFFAAQNGHLEAQLMMAEMAKKSENSREALKWRLRAANQGHPESAFTTGQTCESEEDYTSALTFYLQARLLGYEKGKEECRRIFLATSLKERRDNTEYERCLAVIEDNQGKVFKNTEIAKVYYELYLFHSYGYGEIDIDEEKAKSYLENSANFGYEVAKAELASKNLKKEKDLKAVSEKLDEFISNNPEDIFAKNLLGYFYLKGIGVQKNGNIARVYFRDVNIPEAKYNLAVSYYEEQHFENALKLFEELSKTGHGLIKRENWITKTVNQQLAQKINSMNIEELEEFQQRKPLRKGKEKESQEIKSKSKEDIINLFTANGFELRRSEEGTYILNNRNFNLQKNKKSGKGWIADLSDVKTKNFFTNFPKINQSFSFERITTENQSQIIIKINPDINLSEDQYKSLNAYLRAFAGKTKALK